MTAFLQKLALLLLPAAAQAHEVYVLTPARIAQDVSTTSPDPLTLILADPYQFTLCGIIGIILVSTVFFISISRRVEQALGPQLARLKRWAPLIARLTLGLSLLSSAAHNALFGPELPLGQVFGPSAPIVRAMLAIAGLCVTLGLVTRLGSLLALVVYVWGALTLHWYLLTYINYLGEIALLLTIGSGIWSLDAMLRTVTPSALVRRLEPYGFAITRVCFGIAALYASWYAKLLHSSLALDTVNDYHLTRFFPFSPLFLVLGALIVESLIGIFFIIGFEIRFTALFFLTFLTLSLSYFGEAVWPHLILIGLNLAMIAHGYDRYSLEGRFFKKGGLEPVL